MQGTDDGGDNPWFIHRMFKWIRDNREWIAYESYFQDDAPNNVDNSLFSEFRNRNPLGKAAYIAEMQAGSTTGSGSSSTTGVVTTGNPGSAGALIATIDDQTKTGTNRFVYTGSWNPCGGCNQGAYLNTIQYLIKYCVMANSGLM